MYHPQWGIGTHRPAQAGPGARRAGHDRRPFDTVTVTVTSRRSKPADRDSGRLGVTPDSDPGLSPRALQRRVTVTHWQGLKPRL